MRLVTARSRVRILDVTEILLIIGLVLLFLIALRRAAFCLVIGSVWKAKPCLSVKYLNTDSYSI